MKKKTFNKWIEVLEKHNKRNRNMLKNKELTADTYIILNRLIHTKYIDVIKEYQAK